MPHPSIQAAVTKGELSVPHLPFVFTRIIFPFRPLLPVVSPNKMMKYGRKVSVASMKGPLSHSTSHRSLRHKRYLSSGSGQQPTRRELIDLLQLLNQKQNDLDPLPRDTTEDRTASREHETDPIDLQSEVLSQVLRNSLPAELFEQSEPSFAEQETPGAAFDPDEGNELADYYTRHQDSSAGSLRQVPARFRLPTSIWGRVDGGDEEETRTDPESSPELTLDRLVRMYEALLRSSRD